jgi:hypothetical protein
MGVKTALCWMQALSTGQIGIWGANLRIPEDSYWLLLWNAFTIGPMSADQHKTNWNPGRSITIQYEHCLN